MNWDLTTYFPAFDGPELRQFRAQLQTDIADLSAEAGALAQLDHDSAEAWESVVLRSEDILTRLSHLGSYIGCLCSADVANEAYKKEDAGLSLLQAEAEKLDVELKRALKHAEDDALTAFAQRPALAGCGHFLEREHQDAKQTMSPAEERLGADLGVDGIHAWGRLYDTLSGKLEFDMQYPDGRQERLPISQRRSLMANPDRSVRRAAFEGGNVAWEQVEDVAAAAINAIAGTRLSLNRHRGIESFLDVALFQSDITRRSLDAMFEAIFDSLDLPRRILQIKARAMQTNGVAYYDLEAPLPLPEEEPISWERAKGMVQSAFNQAYPALGQFVGEAYERHWVEWEPRAGKLPGAFCTSSLLTRESRIFMTYNEARGDVRTLAHEAGHAYHSHMLREARAYAHLYPMTLAESASTFAEMLLAEGILKDPDTDGLGRARILDMEAAEGAIFLSELPVRYEFEKAFHEQRRTGEVEVSRLRELMVQTQRRVFGEVLEEGGEDPMFWASKLHFYITGVTFYNFPYTFGYLLSRGLFAQFRERGPDFLSQYEEFLRLTGSASAEEVARRTIGCDLESPAFWKSAIETLREPVEQLEELLPQLAPG